MRTYVYGPTPSMQLRLHLENWVPSLFPASWDFPVYLQDQFCSYNSFFFFLAKQAAVDLLKERKKDSTLSRWCESGQAQKSNCSEEQRSLGFYHLFYNYFCFIQHSCGFMARCDLHKIRCQVVGN